MNDHHDTEGTAAARISAWLSDADHAVVFTGAGMSTESGIPDFRSPSGVWATNRQIYFDEFRASAEARHEYWRQKALAHADFAQAGPNAGHRAVARWEQIGRVQAVITQNIDGLHQEAGSQRVLELHGTARQVGCLSCGTRYDAATMVARFEAEGQPPGCPKCDGIMKHATVSFGQSLPEAVLTEATTHSQRADLYLAMGSSLVVHPAAALPEIAKQHGARLIIINRDPTPLDEIADLVVHAPIGETLQAVEERLQERRL